MDRTIDTCRRDFLTSTTAILASTALGVPIAARAQSSLTELTAIQAVGAMRDGELKAEDYTRALLDRCEALKALNAFITLDRDKALEAARQADLKRASGAPLGPLHGLPIALKDNINTKDLRTTLGTAALKSFQPKQDALVVAKLRSAGAVIFGKNNLRELQWGWTGSNAAFGDSRNPYDPSRIPGGSSSGTAVAVAARMVPVGLGADAAGSIRVPAAFCGITGYRPSVLRWPSPGVMCITQILDTVGPHARSVSDVLLLDSVATGQTAPTIPTPLRGVRIGIIRSHYFQDLDPEIERVTDEVIAKLKGAGAVIVEGDVPEIGKLWEAATWPITHNETKPTITSYLEEFRTGIGWDELIGEAGEETKRDFALFVFDDGKFHAPRSAYEEARKTNRPSLQNAFRRYFRVEGVAAIMSPATAVAAPKIGPDATLVGQLTVGAKQLPFYLPISRNVVPASTSGMPGLVLPGGLTPDGLPVGIEFDGAIGKDHELLTLGLSLEKALGPVAGPKL